jgi:DNA repair photolyase
MSIIYTPKGKAREYSPLALNIYLSCTHHCKYCYAPKCRYQTEDEYFRMPYPRSGISSKLEAELKKSGTPTSQVLLSFIGDVYCETHDNNAATRECLEILLSYKVPVAILTKGGKRCLNDMDLFQKFGPHIQIGTTLTFDNDADSLEWESGAAAPSERLETLKTLHDNGIRTFASFEPVIIPGQSLNLMRRSLDAVDVFKVGKLNNYKGLDKSIDWPSFLSDALDILRPSGRAIYIKEDLRKSAPRISLLPCETSPDLYNVT